MNKVLIEETTVCKLDVKGPRNVDLFGVRKGNSGFLVTIHCSSEWLNCNDVCSLLKLGYISLTCQELHSTCNTGQVQVVLQVHEDPAVTCSVSQSVKELD